MWMLLLGGCGVLEDATSPTFPLVVPVMRSAEPPPVWAADPEHPAGAAYWAALRCAGDPRAPVGAACAGVAPGVCAAARSEPTAWWDVLVGCSDPQVGELLFASHADPAWIGRWFAEHERWDPRLVEVLEGLADRPPGESIPGVTALARHETPETRARLGLLWDARPELRRVLATALAAATDPTLRARLDAWCVGDRADYRCDPERRRDLMLAARPVDDLESALDSPWATPDRWVEAWPDYQSAILQRLERGAAGDDPVVASRALHALALADRRRAAAVAAAWSETESTFEGWDLRTGLTAFPDAAAWETRVVAAGGAPPAAHLVDGWVQTGAAFPALDDGWSDGGPGAFLQAVFARIPGEDPIFADVDPEPREPPFETRVVLYAWWGGERWRVAEAGDVSAAAVGLANVLLIEMKRPERVGLTGDGRWAVVGDGDVLAKAGAEGLVTWYDPAWTDSVPVEVSE